MGILKMFHVENSEKPKLRIFINQLLFATEPQYLHLNEGHEIILNQFQISYFSIWVLKYKIHIMS